MIVFSVRQGDSARTLLVQVTNADTTPIPPIPPGATVAFDMVHKTSGHRVTGSATISGSNSDQLGYTFSATDTARPGRYRAAFVVTYPGGAVETFPTCNDPLDGLEVEVCPAL